MSSHIYEDVTQAQAKLSAQLHECQEDVKGGNCTATVAGLE